MIRRTQFGIIPVTPLADFQVADAVGGGKYPNVGFISKNPRFAPKCDEGHMHLEGGALLVILLHVFTPFQNFPFLFLKEIPKISEISEITF